MKFGLERETETKVLVSDPVWSPELNISVFVLCSLYHIWYGLFFEINEGKFLVTF